MQHATFILAVFLRCGSSAASLRRGSHSRRSQPAERGTRFVPDALRSVEDPLPSVVWRIQPSHAELSDNCSHSDGSRFARTGDLKGSCIIPDTRDLRSRIPSNQTLPTLSYKHWRALQRLAPRVESILHRELSPGEYRGSAPLALRGGLVP